MDIITLEDRFYRKNEIHICITIPKEGMEYDGKVVNRSVKELVKLLHSGVTHGFYSELMKELERQRLEV